MDINKEKLLTAIEQSDSTVVITDREGHIEYVNPAFERITGYTKEEAMGENPRILKSEAKTSDEYKELWETISAGKVWKGEFLNKKKDGSEYWERATISPIFEENGEISGFVAVKENITEMKMISEELRKAKETAENASQAKSQFLANMSHEIRTPMNAVLGMTHLLLQTPLDDLQRDYMGKLDRSARNMLHILNDILDLSKIEAGAVAVEKKEFQIQNLILESIGLFEAKAREKNLRLSYRISSEIEKCYWGDSQKIVQVLQNLVSNAIKFTNFGHVEVRVELLEDGDKTQKLGFYVEDTGMGIQEEIIHHLFAPFMQADASITRKFGGTGLGLSISKKYIEIMDGEIGVTSRQNQGSTFYFILNLDKAKDCICQQEDGKSVATDKRTNPLALKILLVDDNDVNLELALCLLRSWGHMVEMAQSGEEALEKVMAFQYDLVFMDIEMSGINGFDAARTIRKKYSSEQLPVFVISGHGYSHYMEQAAEAGMNGYLIKPLEPARLLEVLGEIQKRKESQRLLQGLESLDGPEVLHRFMGDEEFLLETMGGFYQGAEQLAEELRTALNEKNYEKAGFLVHKIKGTAGNFSAKKLWEAASLMEGEIKQKNSPGESWIAVFFEEWSRFLGDLKKVLAKEETKPEVSKEQKKSLSPEILGKLEELSAIITTRDPVQIGNALRNFFEEYPQAMGVEPLHTLWEMLKNYDYEESLVYIRQMLRGAIAGGEKKDSDCG